MCVSHNDLCKTEGCLDLEQQFGVPVLPSIVFLLVIR